jgi:site-specific recombinase XerC
VTRYASAAGGPIRLAHRTGAAALLEPQWGEAHPLRRLHATQEADRLCAPAVATLRGRRIHPHTLRHTTAVHLLKAGVDFATIRQWLGHASLNTTMVYARADLDLKRQALAQVFPEAPRPPRGGRLGLANVGVVDWLRRL